MLRVLHVLGTLDMGGIENFLMNIYRNIDRNKIQFDFVINDREKEDIFEKEVRSLGGKIYKIPPIVKVGHFKYFKSLREILQKNNYNIIHSHYNAISGFILHEAKKVGIKNRIAHSHIAYPKYSFLSKIYKEYSKFILKKNVTVRFACSEKAGQWLYGKKESFTVIKNGINVSKFSYNTQIREEKRKELNINSDEIVLGHIGRFTKQKNHEYLIEIFRKLHMKNEKYRLILVGTGELEINILEKIKKYKLEENITVLGVRTDVNELLQAFDLFVFPSLYEGLPITLVEAQAAGLKCIVSNTITNEIDLKCGLLYFLDLTSPIEEWVNEIEKQKNYKKRDRTNEVRIAKYDMQENIKEIENIYLQLSKA